MNLLAGPQVLLCIELALLRTLGAVHLTLDLVIFPRTSPFWIRYGDNESDHIVESSNHHHPLFWLCIYHLLPKVSAQGSLLMMMALPAVLQGIERVSPFGSVYPLFPEPLCSWSPCQRSTNLMNVKNRQVSHCFLELC